MNIILGIVSIILCFTTVILMEKIFKKEGLFIWISIATIIANIIVCKTINILGLTSSLGNIMFASNFLATDILTEKYGANYAKKAINYALASIIIFIAVTQISLLYVPDVTDVAQESMKNLFSLSLRTSIASISLFYISNKLDIYLYSKIKNKYPNKLWLRNNVATIISNCLENYFFAFLAFVGIFDIGTILSIATIGSIIEIVIAILDTPFLYISKKLN